MSSNLRQKLLILYLHSPDLNSKVVAWSAYDGAREEMNTSGDSEEPPYGSVVEAMNDGWRVVQFPQQFPAYPEFFYFSHDTPREMGGTMFLPGSHFRRISESDVARYQNFLGQVPMVCEAGTVAVAHHGIWHCAQPNLTGNKRYMFKLRLNPTVRQRQLWNTHDIEDPEIGKILSTNHGWYGNEVRLEIVNRIRFWRFLTGNDDFDVSYWLSRLENKPETELTVS